MIDFMEYGLRKYYQTIGWNEDKYYTNLDAGPNRILVFPIPIGLNFALGKRISPVFKSAYCISIPEGRSAAFMYTSVPVDLPVLPVHEYYSTIVPSPKSYFPFMHKTIETDKANNESISTPVSNSNSYILFGRLFEDLHLEGLYSQLLSPQILLTASTLSEFKWKSDLEKDDFNINAQLVYNGPKICAELSANSDSSIIGGNILGQMSTNWDMGTEVYYTAKENSGGFSLGARYKKQYQEGVESILTLVANPIMGHLNSAYSTTVLKDMQMATRYSFNMYSFNADVSVGVEYAPVGRNQVLKARLSLEEGVALRFDGRFKDIMYSIGMSTGFGPDSKQFFGVQIQL
ncbi:Mitochondrial distribution and morphology protein 10 [Batrachochytrium dendrobatidis]|nr:Mitochondrial distribution and morphology protein 10 [Batrachochytrium dendrobatidis]KAK5664520.1 Mitochondrial distribution and morphology protein 10 [Batrachochytrium dendrobatidis]